ncbi:MAG: Holliday junction branch migration protein RuvA [Coriobacteriia bacterium]|nr:Holliday junction branch migration protein RuvA [Coriobacteriia bacterium]MCL2537242.1 Holliday junction branch migration protein RuvA [Coriobacteriia bacterium]
MIAFLAGTLAYKGSDRVYLEVAGVGYELQASTATLAALGQRGDDVMLYSYMHVRENEVSLFGFRDEEEKQVFLRLIDISGIGPKVALAVLSTLTTGMLAAAVAAEDLALISSVPGIGKKTAQRLVIELKGKLDAVLPEVTTSATGNTGAAAVSDEPNAFADAQAALFSMGFSAAEIAQALAGAATDASSEELLKHALTSMATGGS